MLSSISSSSTYHLFRTPDLNTQLGHKSDYIETSDVSSDSEYSSENDELDTEENLNHLEKTNESDSGGFVNGPETPFELRLRIAEKGGARLCEEYGNSYENDWGDVQQDFQKALIFFLKAIELSGKVDIAKDQKFFDLGQKYFNKEDYSNAYLCFNKITHRSTYRHAAFYLGWMYENQQGTSRNLPKAVYHYLTAGFQHMAAWDALVRLYEAKQLDILNLNELHVKKNSFFIYSDHLNSDTSVKCLIELLKLNCIKSFALVRRQYCPFSTQTLQSIFNALKNNPAITELNLPGRKITALEFQTAMQELHSNTTINHLELSFLGSYGQYITPIEPETVQPIVNMLKANSSIKTLSLHHLMIEDSMLTNLIDALKENTTVETLDLYSSEISQSAEQLLRDWVQTSSCTLIKTVINTDRQLISKHH